MNSLNQGFRRFGLFLCGGATGYRPDFVFKSFSIEIVVLNRCKRILLIESAC